ncbi:hypothetical protein [Sulfitobacter sp. 1A13679]
MFSREEQFLAVSKSVRAAMLELGLSGIRSGEFFGMKQQSQVQLKEAA